MSCSTDVALYVHTVKFVATHILHMSLLSSKKRRQQPQVVASDMFFNLTPQKHPGIVSTSEELKIQQKVIGNMQTQCSDTFSSNRAVKSQQNGSQIYHTSGLYGTGSNSISLEELRKEMTQFNLACSVSFSSPSCQTTTLAMLDASHLSDQNLKKGSVRLEAGNRGSMLVSFQKRGGGHWIESIDYVLPESQ